MSQVGKLRAEVKEKFVQLVDDANAANYFFKQMLSLIETSQGKKEFENFLENNVKIGCLTFFDVKQPIFTYIIIKFPINTHFCKI